MTMNLKKMSRGEAVEGNKHHCCSVFTVCEPCIIMNNKLFFFPYAIDVLDVLTDVDERSRRNPEIIQYFIVSHKQHIKKKGQEQYLSVCNASVITSCHCLQNDLQRLMTSSEELCRNMAFSLALRCIQNNPW